MNSLHDIRKKGGFLFTFGWREKGPTSDYTNITSDMRYSPIRPILNIMKINTLQDRLTIPSND